MTFRTDLQRKATSGVDPLHEVAWMPVLQHGVTRIYWTSGREEEKTSVGKRVKQPTSGEEQGLVSGGKCLKWVTSVRKQGLISSGRRLRW